MGESIGSIYASMGLQSQGFFRESQRVKRELKSLDDSRFGTQLASGFERVRGAVFSLRGAVAALGAGGAAYKALSSFSELEKGLVGVQKTTNASAKEMRAIKEDIVELSREVPVARKSLLDISQAAGQLGVRGADNIRVFTKTVAQMETATDIAGKEAATSLARLINVTGGAIGDVDELGSVIVALGNNMAATESEIVKLATEVGQATAQFSVSAEDATALGAAMKSMGVRAELGGTTVGRAMREIGGAIREGGEEFQYLQELTQMTGAQLRKTFEDDSTKVFARWIEGIGKMMEKNESAEEILERFNLKGEEVLKVLPSLAKNYEILGQSISISNEEQRRGTALTEEAAKAASTFSSQLQLAWNAVDEVASTIGAALAPEIVRLTGDFRDWVASNEDFLENDLAGEIEDVATAIGSVVGTLGKVAALYGGLPPSLQEAGAYGLVGGYLFGGKAGLLIGATVGLTEATKALLEPLHEALDTYNKVAEAGAIADGSISTLEPPPDEEINRHKKFAEALNSYDKNQVELFLKTREGEGSFAAIARVAGNAADTMFEAADAAKLYEKNTDGAFESLFTVNGLLGDIADVGEEVRGLTRDTAEEVKILKSRSSEIKPWVDTKALKEGIELAKELRTPIEKYEASLQRINNLYQKGAISPEVFVRGIERANKAYLAATEETASARIKAEKEAQSEIGKIRDRMLESLQDNTSATFRAMLDDGLDSWDTWADGVVDIVKDTLAQIASLFAQQKIILPIMAQMGVPGVSGMMNGPTGLGSLGQLFGGGGSGGMNIPGVGAVGNALAWNLPGTGGAIEAGTGAVSGMGGLGFGTALGMGGLGALGYSALGGAIGLPQGGMSGVGSFAGGALGSWGGAAAGSAMGVTAGSIAGSIVPVIGTAIGAALGGALGSLFGDDTPDDADLQYTFGGGSAPTHQVPGQTSFDPVTGMVSVSEGYEVESRISRHIGSGGMREGILGLNVKTGDYLGGEQEQKLEKAISSYFQDLFGNMEEVFGISVEKALGENYAEFQIHDFQKYFEEDGGGLKAAISEMTDQFFLNMGESLSAAVLGGGEGISGKTFQTLQQEGESLGQTFQRVMGVMEAVPESMRRIREYMEEGASEAEAVQSLTQDYQSVSSILSPAIEAGLNASIADLDFTAFQEGLTGNIEQQMKAVVVATAKQNFVKDLMEGAFDEVGGIKDLLKSYFSGDIGLDQLTGQFDQAMDRISGAIDEGAFSRLTAVLEKLGLVAEEMEQDTKQRAEAEQYLKKQYEEGTEAATDYANALSATEIRQRQAAIAGRSGQFQLQQIALDFGWHAKYGGIPSRAEIQRGINWATSASPEALRAKADQLGITTEQLLENVSMLDEALDNMGSSADDAARASERAADALSRQAETLQDQISAVESIQDLLNNLQGGGSLAPVTSMEFFERRYEQLLAEAQGGDPRAVSNFTQFAQQFLDFAQSYGGSYAGIAGGVIEDLQDLQDGIAGDKTLSDLYAQLDRTNDRLEYIRTNTRETVTTMADAFTEALEQAIGTSGDTPWAENWNMSRWLSDLQSGMSTAIENWREDPSGFEAMKGFLGEGSGLDISQAVGGGWQAVFRGEGGGLIDRFTFSSPEEITPDNLWNLVQDNPVLKEYWKNIMYPGTDIPKYWIGAQSGATVSGPESGFDLPMKFHGTEHITPDSEMKEVKDLLSAILDRMESGGEGEREVVVNVDGKALFRIMLERGKYDKDFAKLVQRVRAA